MCAGLCPALNCHGPPVALRSAGVRPKPSPSPSPGALQPFPFPLPAGAPRVRSSRPRPAGGGRPLPGAQAGPRARPASPPRAGAEERAPRTHRLGREGGLGSPEEGSGKAAKGAEGAGRAGLGGDAEGAGRAAFAPAAALQQRAAGPGTQLGDGDRDPGPSLATAIATRAPRISRRPTSGAAPAASVRSTPESQGLSAPNGPGPGATGSPDWRRRGWHCASSRSPGSTARPRGAQTCRDCGQREGEPAGLAGGVVGVGDSMLGDRGIKVCKSSGAPQPLGGFLREY